MRSAGWRRFLLIPAVVLATAAGFSCAALAQPAPLQGFGSSAGLAPSLPVTAFYDPPSIDGRKPGDLLRSELIAAPPGVGAWRILYVSKGAGGAPAAVSGVVLTPGVRMGKIPRRVLAWSHGTTGGARGCAPSLSAHTDQVFRERGPGNGEPIDTGVPYLQDFLARGEIVVAPDDAGLGAPGVHPYLVGETAAQNLLDAVRAARHLPGVILDENVEVMGWSQGGQGALFAGEIAPAYAPELHVTGVATLAPAATVMHSAIDALFKGDTPHVYEIVRGYQAAYGLNAPFLTDRGRTLVEAAGKVCILGVFDAARALPGPGVIGDVSAAPGWVKAFTANQSGLRRSAAPVLVAHGAADKIVAPAGTDLYRDRACKAGTSLTVRWFPGADHRSLIPAARETILAWLDARAKGEPAPSDCGKS